VHQVLGDLAVYRCVVSGYDVCAGGPQVVLLRLDHPPMLELRFWCAHRNLGTYRCAGVRWQVTVSVRVVRKWSFFAWTILLPCSLLVLLGFLTFLLPPEDVTDRMGISLNLILTLVAFKFVIASFTVREGRGLDWVPGSISRTVHRPLLVFTGLPG
jgi:hypothetical protein